ncbi:MAG: hypothetical protein R2744_10310 [Bacteroidales bacterium]
MVSGGSLDQVMSEEAADNDWSGTGIYTTMRRLGNGMNIDDIRPRRTMKGVSRKGKASGSRLLVSGPFLRPMIT